MFRAFSLDGLLCDNISRGEKDGCSHGLCDKWSLDEKVTVIY